MAEKSAEASREANDSPQNPMNLQSRRAQTSKSAGPDSSVGEISITVTDSVTNEALAGKNPGGKPVKTAQPKDPPPASKPAPKLGGPSNLQSAASSTAPPQKPAAATNAKNLPKATDCGKKALGAQNTPAPTARRKKCCVVS